MKVAQSRGYAGPELEEYINSRNEYRGDVVAEAANAVPHSPLFETGQSLETAPDPLGDEDDTDTSSGDQGDTHHFEADTEEDPEEDEE